MNRRVRLAVLTPLAVSSLAFGSVSLLAGSAQAAVPSLTCSVKQTPTSPGHYDVNVKGAQPGVEVVVEGGSATHSFTSSGNANDNGEFNSTSGFIPAGKVTASSGGDKATCGTVKEAEQQDAQAQYSKGFRKGFDDTKTTCKAVGEQKQNNLTQLDPNYEKGYNAGAKAALESKFC
ncbi:hypothetical protein GCM10010347_57540 [Streptomyces cirratus]|uniref:Secreted protein n=1 Tax=Streptomyces cirratus TaxID=68187 RepID=A0ABQ3F404_9ACTN|nr:hypothetical protein [Streptomyces cirratus]GHB79591.1 hypothetical protein GCM10010347_57540 [Streptomyces cirratus]